MKLSNNFTLEELIKSETAIRRGINNTPSSSVVENLQQLVTNVLQPIRDKFGPITVTSGYRSAQLNVAIGGSATSDHVLGMAADIGVQGAEAYRVLALACKHGFSGIGVQQKGTGRFIHVDVATTELPRPNVWSY